MSGVMDSKMFKYGRPSQNGWATDLIPASIHAFAYALGPSSSFFRASRTAIRF
jgi:hypothetical protein